MPKFQGQTDQVLKIKLPSALLGLHWGFAQAVMGASVPMEAVTQFVADGSEIKLTVRDGEGNALDTVPGKIYGNRCRIPYKLSKPNKTGAMFFEAELSKHSLKGMSGKIKVVAASSESKNPPGPQKTGAPKENA